MVTVSPEFGPPQISQLSWLTYLQRRHLKWRCDRDVTQTETGVSFRHNTSQCRSNLRYANTPIIQWEAALGGPSWVPTISRYLYR